MISLNVFFCTVHLSTANNKPKDGQSKEHHKNKVAIRMHQNETSIWLPIVVRDAILLQQLD